MLYIKTTETYCLHNTLIVDNVCQQNLKIAIFGIIYFSLPGKYGMKEKGCYEYAVDSRDLDYRGRVTLSAMIHYIMDAAGQDSDLNGFGVRDLNVDNCSWVLTRMCVEFYEWPGEEDTFTVRTWVSDVNRMMTTRNMAVTADDGGLIAAAVTQWSVIDLDRRAALDVRAHIDFEGKVSGEPSPVEKPERIGQVAAQQVGHHRVAYGDIDFNHHMNSLRYIGLMADMIPVSYYETRRVARADINFIHEALYGQEITVGYEQQGAESLFEVAGTEGQPLCRAAFRWTEE